MALTPFLSNLIADTGISFGDEGKGRLISEVIHELREARGENEPVRLVLKVNGGANSGHTAGGLKLNLLPGAVIEPDVPYLGLGSGVVADPRKLWWETRATESRGFSVMKRLRIDERTMLSDLSHRILDLAWEHYREHTLKAEPRGSTGRGISPAYNDETGQWQMYYVDFLGDPDLFRENLRKRMDRACATIRHVCGVDSATWYSFFERLSEAEGRANAAAIEDGIFPAEEFDFTRFQTKRPFELDQDILFDTYWQAGQRFCAAVVDIRNMVLDALAEGKAVIGEFGQAYWLDKRHGFPPNVTASHAYTPEFFQSAGIPVQPLHTFGVCKAYDTKVGTHDFRTEIPRDHSLAQKLAKLEFGTSTGRQRMVGWFDAVEKGTVLRYGGFDDLAINKLDALTQGDSWSGTLKICTAYEAPDGTLHHHVPRQEALRRTLRPVYEEYEPWSEDISGVCAYRELPAAARAYVAGMIQSTLRCAYGPVPPKNLTLNLRYIGVGPEPKEIIKDIPSLPEILAEVFVA